MPTQIIKWIINNPDSTLISSYQDSQLVGPLDAAAERLVVIAAGDDGGARARAGRPPPPLDAAGARRRRCLWPPSAVAGLLVGRSLCPSRRHVLINDFVNRSSSIFTTTAGGVEPVDGEVEAAAVLEDQQLPGGDGVG